MPAGPSVPATITDLRDTTPNTRVFTLRVEAAGYHFQPGQHCLVSVDGQRARPFSFTTTPRQYPRVEFVIKLAGVTTGQLFSCRVGDRVWLSQPLPSRFFIAPDDHGAVVLIAGGTGVTPFLGLIRDCTERSAPNTLQLLFANRSLADIICRAELSMLAQRNSKLEVVFVLDDPPAGWAGEAGRIDVAMIRRHVPDFQLPRFMLCGRPQMVISLRQQLLAAGVAADRIAI